MGWAPAPLCSRTSEMAVGCAPRSLIKSAAETTKGPDLALPVAGAVVLGVGAGGVLHDDGITGAEVVEEPPCVGGADVDAAVTDVALTLVIHRPRSAVDEVAAVVEPDG